MITIKLPYYLENKDDLSIINDIIREQTIVKKFSYNRFLENKSEKDIRNLIPSLNNIEHIDSWFIQSSIYDGKQIFLSNKNKKVIFNKYNFKRRLKHLISKEEYKKSINNYIFSIGEAPQKGNRKFQLIMEENSILFKPNRKEKILIKLPSLRNNIKNKLINLDLLSKQNKATLTFKLDINFIYITFDETILNEKQEYSLKENRVMGIDLNPNYIGLSILEFNANEFNVIKTFAFDIKLLTQKKGNHNKLKHETIEITKKIINICKEYKVKNVVLEELNIKSKINNNKNLNSLTINKWLRNLFTEQLEKRSKNISIKVIKILPYYTSYIGNLMYDFFDPVSASIEIARRGYEVTILKNKQFYPNFKLKTLLKDQWKEYLNNVEEWKTLFSIIKNLKLRYRVSLDDTKFDVFRFNSTKSKVHLYNFV